jgi:hypothetical protein
VEDFVADGDISNAIYASIIGGSLEDIALPLNTNRRGLQGCNKACSNEVVPETKLVTSLTTVRTKPHTLTVNESIGKKRKVVLREDTLTVGRSILRKGRVLLRDDMIKSRCWHWLGLHQLEQTRKKRKTEGVMARGVECNVTPKHFG